MMIEINKDVIYVKGAKNGAIYDFNTGKVFAINHTACSIVDRVVNGTTKDEDIEYLNMLTNENLLDQSIDIKPFVMKPKKKDLRLEMAWIEITQQCNLKCLHCYEGQEHVSLKKTLNLEEWQRVIDQLVEMGINRLIIIGGEPCLSKDVMSIISYANKYAIDITLFTNATCINNELMKHIIDTKIDVKVSIYGHCSEIHDKITGVKGSFDKMCRAIDTLISNGIIVYSAVIIMKENQQYINDIIDFLKEKGINFSRYDVIRNVHGGTQKEHSVTDKDVLKTVSLMKPSFKAKKQHFFDNMVKNSCWYGKIAILENGDVIPCEFEREIIYGNVRKKPIRDIVSSEKTLKYWLLDFSNIDECKDCEFRFACKDCRPLGISEKGNICGKNPRCHYDVYRGIWI